MNIRLLIWGRWLWLALALAAGGCREQPADRTGAGRLRVLCGSSMAAPMQEMAQRFGAERQVRIEVDLGGSETLLPKILAGARADVFVCHDPFEEKIKAAGCWENTAAVGYLEPVVAVRPGNPKGIRTMKDLTRAGLKLGIGDPRYSTCGELFVNALKAQGLYEGVMSNVVLQARSHAEVANGLVVGPLDAVVVWNFVIGLYPGKLTAVPTGVSYPATRVTVLGLRQGENPQARDAFLAWCQTAAVQEIFRRHGYGRAQE